MQAAAELASTPLEVRPATNAAAELAALQGRGKQCKLMHTEPPAPKSAR